MNPPRMVQIEVSTQCNAACLFCDWHPSKGGSLLSWEMFERALALVQPGMEVALFGRGEPLLHPRFLDMAAAVRARGAMVATSTNGVLLTPELAFTMHTKIGFDAVWVSIAHPEAEAHQRLQRGVDSDLVWSNLEAAARTGMRVGTATVVVDENISALRAFLDRVVACGVGEVSFLRRLDIVPSRDVFRPAVRERHVQYVEDAIAYAQTLGVTVHDVIGERTC